MSVSPRAHHKLARILVVDDDLPLVRALKVALESQGYVISAVNRGTQALEAIERFRPDLVLLDVMMPGIDGWEVLTRLRANPLTESTPVIMLTGADSDASKVKGFSLGTDDYMTKPFSLQELRCRVAAVLRRSSPKPNDVVAPSIPVVVGESGFQLIRSGDVYFAEGIRNYTYIHTFDARFLCRLTLGALDDKGLDDFMRVHRSFVVNLRHVGGCGWATSSSYRLRLSDLAGTEIPVSRGLVLETQRRLGLKD
jgi:CheY-like chemotaxis protein